MPERKISNLLALAVLTMLAEKPMHPYEMAFEMRARALGESIKLNYGSLYTVVEALQREGLVVPRETQRQGRRPERTVYALTETGRAELDRWLREVLRTPVKEYPQFGTGLALIHHLPLDETASLLRERVGALDDKIDEARFVLDTLLRGGQGRPALPRLCLIESEYALMLCEAERDWLRRIVAEITDGTLTKPTAFDSAPIMLSDGSENAEPSVSEGDEGE